MNERTEEVYIQMFAPEPVPPEVVELFDRTNFLASRVDSTVMRSLDLALIAAVAVSMNNIDLSAKTVSTRDEDGNHIASEPIKASGAKKREQARERIRQRPKIVEEAPETPQDGQTPVDETKTTPGGDSVPGGPTGPMDAPARPRPKKNQESKPNEVLSAYTMKKMGQFELRSYAKRVFGINFSKKQTKKFMIETLKDAKPKI